MPKNPKLNIARYKVDGGELNPFEFNQNQQAFVEQQQHDADNLIPGTPPEMRSESQEGTGGHGASVATAVTESPARSTKKARTTKKAVSQKGREKSTKKSAKKTKPAKRSTASKGRPAKKAAKRSTKKAASRSTKKAAKRSTKKAAKKTGTKKKARK